MHQRVGVRWLGHLGHIGVRLAAQRSELALQLVDDLQNLGDFLLAEEIDLQIEIGRASCRERVLMPV